MENEPRIKISMTVLEFVTMIAAMKCCANDLGAGRSSAAIERLIAGLEAQAEVR